MNREQKMGGKEGRRAFRAKGKRFQRFQKFEHVARELQIYIRCWAGCKSMCIAVYKNRGGGGFIDLIKFSGSREKWCLVFRVQDNLEKRRGTSATVGWVISHVYKKWYRETRALEGDVIPCRYLRERFRRNEDWLALEL